MTITDIKVRKLFNQGKLKGIVSMTIDDILAVHDIKVIEGEERLFIAMPSRKDTKGSFKDIIHPITVEARKNIEEKILSAYKNEVENQKDSN